MAAQAAQSLSVRPANPTARPAAFDRIEWIIDLDRTYENPFDPDEISVDATFTGPNRRTLSVPAFWHQEFQRQVQPNGRERLTPAGPAHFRLRFCPPTAGDWQFVVSAKDRLGLIKSVPVSLSVAPSNHPGFIRRVPDNPRYFQYDSGRPYFIVGLNTCWSGSGGLGSFEKWFSRLAAARGNFARLWMTSPGRPIETKEAGLGKYDLAACAFYDHILELAAKDNIACMFAFHSYGDLITGGHFGEGKWAVNPYNAANGGPATQPANFFTEPLARKMYQRRLRYMIGRYSAYTSLAFWEFFNEQDLTKVTIAPDWVREMALYLKTHDPYRHLVTTSFSSPGDSAMWSIPELDLTQRHLYGDEDSLFDASPVLANSARLHAPYRKPHLIGEYGISWRGSDSKYDPAGLGTNLHNSLWSTALSGSAGGSCNWWWDSYIDPKGLWKTFTGLSRFAAAVDWPRRSFEPLRVSTPTFPDTQKETFKDLVLAANPAWGKSPGATLTVAPDGVLSADLPGFLFGPAKADMRVRTTLKVNLPNPSQLVIRVLKVSDHAMLRVAIDGKPAVDFAFSALPGAADQESTKPLDEGSNHYQAVFNKDRALNIPAGQHTIELDLVGGDWLSIKSLTFTNALSSRYTGLRVTALADGISGETLAWVHDPASHCGSDLAGLPPRQFQGALLRLPVSQGGPFKLDWWDTRSGAILQTQTLSPTDAHLVAPIPPFQRDIALRVTPSR